MSTQQAHHDGGDLGGIHALALDAYAARLLVALLAGSTEGAGRVDAMTAAVRVTLAQVPRARRAWAGGGWLGGERGRGS